MKIPHDPFPDAFNLAQYFLFDRIDEGLGDKVALRYGGQSFSYGEVVAKTRAFASALLAEGLGRGDRVLILLPDAPPFAWSFFGALAAGGVVAMGNPDAPGEQIEYLVEYTGATCIVATPRVADVLHARTKNPGTRADVRRIFVVPDSATFGESNPPCTLPEGHRFLELSAAIASADPNPTLPTLHRDEPAIWLFTSGSTGEPKANIHAHRDFGFNTEAYAKRTVKYARDDITVSVPRLFFGYATGTNLMFPFAVGATVGLFSERPTVESLALAIAHYRPTIVTNVPTMIGKLLDFDDAARRNGEAGVDLSSVRFSLSAGEALPEALLHRWTERFGSDIYDGIGSAEMFHIYASNRPGDIKPGSLGKVVEGYELRILPEDACGPGGPECATGEIGVLWVRGDSVSFGYWRDREKSWSTFFGHWCKTGDLFRIDGDGYLYFAGRADELLKVSGLWVAPVEVEECLMRHPSVLSAAVIGVEDDGLMKTKAFVVLRNGVDASEVISAELKEFVKARLSKHKYPRVIEFVDDLPKNDRGKIDRKALRNAALTAQTTKGMP